MFKLKNNQIGFAAIFITILVLVIILGIALSISLLTFGQQKISANIVRSSQAYYIAEAGIEDALLRLKQNYQMAPLSYNLNVGNGSIDVDIPSIVGGSRTVTSQGNISNRIRKIQIVYSIDTEEISFQYGAQVGDGGLVMDNDSKVYGNVFSNGNISCSNTSLITDTVIVAGLGNTISGAIIGGDLYVNTCNNSTISGDLYALVDNSCSYSSFISQAPPDLIPLPISDAKITEWKQEAEAGGIIGDYNLAGSSSDSLGPVKINGDLTLENNSELTITGTIWVTGNVNVKNDVIVHLSFDYGTLSGIFISDGIITLENDSRSSGSGQPGSYLLYISTSLANPAILTKNDIKADIIYTNNGWIAIENDVDVREVIGYGLYLKNDAKIIYEVGLANAVFTSGPGGSWQVQSWKEIE